jgi:hypothetical protein
MPHWHECSFVIDLNRAPHKYNSYNLPVEESSPIKLLYWNYGNRERKREDDFKSVWNVDKFFSFRCTALRLTIYLILLRFLKILINFRAAYTFKLNVNNFWSIDTLHVITSSPSSVSTNYFLICHWRLSRRWRLILWSCGLWHLVWQMGTNLSGGHAAYIFKVQLISLNWKLYDQPKILYNPTRLHGTIIQKTAILISSYFPILVFLSQIAMETLNLVKAQLTTSKSLLRP